MTLATSEPVKNIGGPYNLGRLSIPLNVIGVLYLIFTTITFNFPIFSPVTSENMNYTSAAVGAILLIATVTWFTTGRRQYHGPQSGGVILGKGQAATVTSQSDHTRSSTDAPDEIREKAEH